MTFGKFEHGKWFSIAHFGFGKNLAKITAAHADDFTGTFDSIFFEHLNRDFNVIHLNGHVMQNVIAISRYKWRNNRSLPPLTYIPLIDKYRGKTGFTQNSGPPIIKVDKPF